MNLINLKLSMNINLATSKLRILINNHPKNILNNIEVIKHVFELVFGKKLNINDFHIL